MNENEFLKSASKEEIRGVIRFFRFKKYTAIQIHRELTAVYGQDVMSVQKVRNWCRMFDSGRESAADKARSGRPSVVNDDLVKRIETKIRADRRVTFDELKLNFDVSRGTLYSIVHDRLQFRKLCARWVPKMLTPEHKAMRMATSIDILQMFNEGGNEFLDKIVTGDETWIHYDTPETKRQSMQWKHRTSPSARKFKQGLSLKKTMASVFWDSKGVILIDFMARGTTINGEVYRDTLTRLRKAIKDRRPGRLTQGVLLLCDNARPHTARETCALVEKFKWVTLPHPAYSPDLAPSDYHLFRKLKTDLGGVKFETEEELKNYVVEYFKKLDEKFYEEGFSKLIYRLDKCLNLYGDYVEK